MSKIVFKGKSKNGNEIIIRYPEKSDLQELLKFINELSQEKTFILYQGEVIKEEDEIKYLDEILKSIEEKKIVHLLVFSKDKLIGAAGIAQDKWARKHIANFHIAILKDFRGEGIGELLMTKIIEEVLAIIPDIEILCLSVFSKNAVAYTMYKKFGFTEYGRLSNGVKHDNVFDDEIFLFKEV